MKKKIRIIINPISGTGKQKNAKKMLKKLLDTQLFDSEFFISRQRGHLTILAREAAEKKYDAVIVMGGDGSVNEAIEGLIGTQTALGIIPIGSGNALARHLKIPMSIQEAVRRINQFNIRRIDTAKINEKAFVSLAGIGFDAKVAEKFSRVKKRGLWNYIKITIREFFRSAEEEYTIFLDGKTHTFKALMLVFANANQFGNNLVISPEGLIDDGLLDVCIVKKPKIYQIPFVFYLFLRKRIHHSKLVQIQRAKNIQLELNQPQNFNLDGESIRLKGSIEIIINPLSLSVIS